MARMLKTLGVCLAFIHTISATSCTAGAISNERTSAETLSEQLPGEECTVWWCVFYPCLCAEDCGNDGGSNSGGSGALDGNTDVGEVDIDTSAPTPAPSSSPTPAPTSSPTPAPSPPAVTCARKCGEPENGGGTCNPNDPNHCTSCNDGMLLTTSLSYRVNDSIKGDCISRITCDRRIIIGGRHDGTKCTPCLDRHCHKCVISHPAGAPGPTEVCQKCRDGYYLNGTECIEECEPQYALSGANMFGRRCVEPFTCRSGRVMNYTDSRGCKCPNPENTIMDANCHTCEFRAGEFGQRCSWCRNFKFLYNDVCHDDCSSFPGTVPYVHGGFGSECREPFTCIRGVDSNGKACKCRHVFPGCQSCSFGLNGNICLDGL